jgi:hypothetical protein
MVSNVTVGGVRGTAVSGGAEVPLACKRNRQDGVSGDPFLTTPIEKYLNTRRVKE